MPDQKIVNGVTVREVEEMNELLSGATLVKGSGFVWPNRAEYMITFLGDRPYMDRSLNGKIIQRGGGKCDNLSGRAGLKRIHGIRALRSGER